MTTYNKKTSYNKLNKVNNISFNYVYNCKKHHNNKETQPTKNMNKRLNKTKVLKKQKKCGIIKSGDIADIFKNKDNE